MVYIEQIFSAVSYFRLRTSNNSIIVKYW